jgi:exopolyphosphatase / guanosine-5'-triphosphate,3'-diphosphate pyrophosphatase
MELGFPMQPIRRAVIDVGTNSVKLLVADVDGREIWPVSEQSQQTRLGHGFYETHRLQPEAIAATARAVSGFAAAAREAQAASIRTIATSAAREALNRDELTSAIEQASGVKVEVISGEQEAVLGFQGVTTDPQLAQGPVLLMDVGGGSAQFVFGCDGRAQFSHSFPLGSVRLLETLPCSDPPKPAELAACRAWLKDFLNKEVRPRLQEGGARCPQRAESEQTGPDGGVSGTATRRAGDSAPYLYKAQLVGVGGTASILGCMEAELTKFDRVRLEATHLPAARVSWHLEQLWRLPLEQRKLIVGLPKNRADIILMGVAIYQTVMEIFGFLDLRISTRGLRFAALLHGDLKRQRAPATLPSGQDAAPCPEGPSQHCSKSS